MNHAFHRSDLGALADTSGNPSRFTADAPLTWPKIERRPTVMRYDDGRETLVLPVTNTMPLDAELEPVSSGPTHIAAPVARVDELKAALGHTASMPRNLGKVNEAGHRAVTWVGAVLTFALVSAIAMGAL